MNDKKVLEKAKEISQKNVEILDIQTTIDLFDKFLKKPKIIELKLNDQYINLNLDTSKVIVEQLKAISQINYDNKLKELKKYIKKVE